MPYTNKGFIRDTARSRVGPPLLMHCSGRDTVFDIWFHVNNFWRTIEMIFNRWSAITSFESENDLFCVSEVLISTRTYLAWTSTSVKSRLVFPILTIKFWSKCVLIMCEIKTIAPKAHNMILAKNKQQTETISI